MSRLAPVAAGYTRFPDVEVPPADADCVELLRGPPLLFWAWFVHKYNAVHLLLADLARYCNHASAKAASLAHSSGEVIIVRMLCAADSHEFVCDAMHVFELQHIQWILRTWC